MKTIAVIDSHSLMHRAFHAVPDYMTAPDGRPTNACFGFMSMFIKLYEDFKPDAIICAFDKGVPAFRLDALSQYKAQRPPTDPSLKEQFPIMMELLRAMNIPVVQIQDFEGDDILGTLARMGDEQGYKTLLVSGDKDVLQLASETTSIVTTRTGMSDIKVYTPEDVLQRYGVGPELVADFIALKGDTSDNIPGAPGVGEKTAAKLIQQFGNVESIIEHASEIKGKISDSIASSRVEIENGKVVATIVKDAPIDLDLESVHFPSFNPGEVVSAFNSVKFTSHLNKVLKIGEGFGIEGEEFSESTFDVEAFFAELPQILREKDASEFVEHLANDKLKVLTFIKDTGASDLFSPQEVLVIKPLCADSKMDDRSSKAAMFDGPDILSALSTIIGKCQIVSTDSKRLFKELFGSDTSISCPVDPGEIDSSQFFDLSIAAYLLNSSSGDYSQEALFLEYVSESETLEQALASVFGAEGGTAEVGIEKIAAASAVVTEALYSTLKEKLKNIDTQNCFEKIEMPLVSILAEMERYGACIDVPLINKINDEIGSEIEGIQAKIHELAGEDFNIASPKQLAHILFEVLRLPITKKGRSGPSTDASVLKELSAMHELPKLVIEYRELAKIKNTYLDTLPALLKADGKIHTTFNQAVTATGRLSSSDPNMQNIPVRSELGLRIRGAFIPEQIAEGEETLFFSADYSQIELRLLAAFSEEEGLIDAFNSGEDFHAATAARVFGVALDSVDSKMRARAKAVNFGIVYGQQAHGLSQTLGLSNREAQEMIDRYFSVHPKVRKYLDRLVHLARDNGYVETLFGRRRYIPEITSRNFNLRSFGERTAMNHPMQGSAADIIKLAMIEISKRIKEQNLRSQMILQVHDELDFNCPTSERETLSALVKDAMEGVVNLSVPMKVSIASGANWYEAK